MSEEIKKIEELEGFKNMRIVDNFYQTSSFFPMPTIEISTLDEEGRTTIGSYSLCFPYYIAGKGYYAMVLECRNSSNTCKNILRTKKCALNFITHDKKFFKEAVRLGFPGDTPEEKRLLYTEVPITQTLSLRSSSSSVKTFPLVILRELILK